MEGIVLTDAELDHTLGIALLREGRRLQLYATSAVVEVLSEDSRILPVTAAFAEVGVTELRLEQATPLRYHDGSESGISVTPFAVAAGPPRFARRELAGHTVGLLIKDSNTGGTWPLLPDAEPLTRHCWPASREWRRCYSTAPSGPMTK